MKSSIQLIKLIVLLCVFTFSTQIYAKTYRCTQENGVILYSDQECESKSSVAASKAVETTKMGVDTSTGMMNVISGILGSFREQIKSSNLMELVFYSYILMSLVCFTAYWRDKQAAINETRRIPESRLHLYELFGGWPGGLLAQRIIRHKSRKTAYQVKFWLIVIANLITVGYIFWLQSN